MDIKELLKEKIKSAKDLINKNMPNVSKFLCDMIKIPSLSGSETNIITRIKKEMVKCLFDNIYIDRIGNIIGRIGNGKKIILMEAHIDVVDALSLNLWKNEPFNGIIRNGRIYGRGAADQKGAIAAMLYSAYILKKLNLLGNYSLFIAGTVMFEKCPGIGLEHLIGNEKLNPNCVIITAPTNLNIHIAQKGHLQLKLSVYGKSSHSGLGELSKSAIYKNLQILQVIKKINQKLKSDKYTGKNKISVTGVVTKNPEEYTIPSLCEIYLDFQLSPNMTKNNALNQIKKYFNKFSNIEIDITKYNGYSYKEYKILYEKYLPGWHIEKKSKLIRIAEDTYKLIYNKAPQFSFWQIPTSGSISMGKFKIPTLGFGPGNVKDIHTENESISIEQIRKSMLFYIFFPLIYSEYENLF